MRKRIWLHGLLSAMGVVLYITGVAFVLTNVEKLFDGVADVWVASTMLLLFVFSALVMVLLIFGPPVFHFLEGRKRESWQLILITTLFLFLVLLFTLALHALF